MVRQRTGTWGRCACFENLKVFVREPPSLLKMIEDFEFLFLFFYIFIFILTSDIG